VQTKPNYITVSSGDLRDLVTTTISYEYDPLYRLTSATYSIGDVYTYTYDAVGNRLAMGAAEELIPYTYAPAVPYHFRWGFSARSQVGPSPTAKAWPREIGEPALVSTGEGEKPRSSVISTYY
jgi:YD repeat-containing protein